MGRTAEQWLTECQTRNIPAGPVNDLSQVFASPQVTARAMKIDMDMATGARVSLIGNPLKLSRTPVTYAKAPPALGADTGPVLARLLGLTPSQLAALAADGVIDGELNP